MEIRLFLFFFQQEVYVIEARVAEGRFSISSVLTLKIKKIRIPKKLL